MCGRAGRLTGAQLGCKAGKRGKRGKRQRRVKWGTLLEKYLSARHIRYTVQCTGTGAGTGEVRNAA